MKEQDNILKAFELVGKYSKEMEPGEKKVVECPFCKGNLHVGKSSYNGHMHMACDKCDFSLMQ